MLCSPRNKVRSQISRSQVKRPVVDKTYLGANPIMFLTWLPSTSLISYTYISTRVTLHLHVSHRKIQWCSVRQKLSPFFKVLRLHTFIHSFFWLVFKTIHKNLWITSKRPVKETRQNKEEIRNINEKPMVTYYICHIKCVRQWPI